MIKLLKSPTILGRTLRTGIAALMLAGVFAGAAAGPALADGWDHGPRGYSHGGWHHGWNAYRGGYGVPYADGYYGPGYYGYAAPPVVFAAPGVAVSVPLVVR